MELCRSLSFLAVLFTTIFIHMNCFYPYALSVQQRKRKNRGGRNTIITIRAIYGHRPTRHQMNSYRRTRYANRNNIIHIDTGTDSNVNDNKINDDNNNNNNIRVGYTQKENKNVENVDNAPNSTNLIVGHLNARSARNKTCDIVDLIEEQDIDIFFITETWFTEKGDEPLIASITPPNYKFQSFPRKDKRGGGIGVVIKKCYESCITNIKRGSSISFESVQVTMKIKNHPYIFVCIYRPPKNSVCECMNELSDMVTSLNFKQNRIMLIGDFNIHYNSGEKIAEKTETMLIEHDLKQLCAEPTHEGGYIIDWIVAPINEDWINNTFVLHKLISDHHVLMCELDTKKLPPVKRTIESRDLKNLDMTKFRGDLKETFSLRNNLSFDDFDKECLSLIDKHAPIIERNISERPNAPWFTTDVKQVKRDKRRAERMWKKTGLHVHKDIYKHCKITARQICDNAKSEYYNDKLQTVKNCKDLFQTTDEMLGKSKSQVLPTNVSKNDLPRMFLSFFDNKVKTIRENFPKSVIKAPIVVCDKLNSTYNNVKELKEFRTISEKEIIEIILDSPSKSCELDTIPTPLMKKCLNELVPTIRDIINDSLSTGVVPDPFKKAIVRPLLKKHNLDQNDLKNYRPVSNLSFLSKILEKVVLKQILAYLGSQNLTEKFQSAYKSFHSTETALLRVFNDIVTKVDEGNMVLLNMLDLSSAFDTIDHGILLHRLNVCFNISGNALQWFQSYLKSRMQCVKINDVYSESLELCYGVPQGSVLGPILFSLYIQPLSKIIDKHDFQYHLYADDSQIYKSVQMKNMPHLIQCFEKCMIDVKEWMVENKLQLNESKTESIIIGKPSETKNVQISHVKINGNEIMPSKKIKNLGVMFDENLSMSEQISAQCKSLYCEIRRIGLVRKFLSTDVTKQLMITLVLSKLDYCNSLLSGLPCDLLDKIQRVQNTAARIIFQKKKSDHITPLLDSLHWLPVKSRIDYKIALIVFKCLNGLAPAYLSELVKLKSNPRSLRSSNDTSILTVPRKKLKSFGDRSFEYYGPKIWNSLPKNIRELKCINAFKSAVKTHYFVLNFRE